MPQVVLDLHPGAGPVLFLLAGGVLGDPHHLDRRGRVDHRLGAVDLAGQVDGRQAPGAGLGVRKGLTHERESLRELVDHVF